MRPSLEGTTARKGRRVLARDSGMIEKRVAVIIHDLSRFRLLHLTYPELNEEGYNSSCTREARYKHLVANKTATSVQDLLKILGNRDDNPYPLFSDRAEARVSTINLG